MTPHRSRRRLPAARVVAAVQRVNAEDIVLVRQINDLAASIHRVRSGIEPPAVDDRPSHIRELEKQVDDLYARRRKLAARAKAAALDPSAVAPEA